MAWLFSTDLSSSSGVSSYTTNGSWWTGAACGLQTCESEFIVLVDRQQKAETQWVGFKVKRQADARVCYLEVSVDLKKVNQGGIGKLIYRGPFDHGSHMEIPGERREALTHKFNSNILEVHNKCLEAWAEFKEMSKSHEKELFYIDMLKQKLETFQDDEMNALNNDLNSAEAKEDFREAMNIQKKIDGLITCRRLAYEQDLAVENEDVDTAQRLDQEIKKLCEPDQPVVPKPDNVKAMSKELKEKIKEQIRLADLDKQSAKENKKYDEADRCVKERMRLDNLLLQIDQLENGFTQAMRAAQWERAKELKANLSKLLEQAAQPLLPTQEPDAPMPPPAASPGRAPGSVQPSPQMPQMQHIDAPLPQYWQQDVPLLQPCPPISVDSQPTEKLAIDLYSKGDQVYVKSKQSETLVQATVLDFPEDNTVLVEYKIEHNVYQRKIKDANKSQNVSTSSG